MSMDLVTVPESEWFEFDDRYLPEMEEKRRLLAERRDEVFAALPVSDAGRTEALEMIIRTLTRFHADWFGGENGRVRNRLTGEAWADGELDPLDLAGRLVQEDLCIIQPSDEGPVFTAASLCFPSRWKLHEKIGKPLASVHTPVPFYAERLAKPVDRFMQFLRPNRIASRLNWSLLDDPALFQPGGKWRVTSDAGITPENVGNRVFLRVERQTLRRLPASDAVLFGIRVHVYPVSVAASDARQANLLAAAVRALPAEIQHYKSLRVFREALMGYLDGAGTGSLNVTPPT